MPAPANIVSLIERFERNFDSYKLQNYNEAQVRSEFINPFFETLGWDVSNKKGYAEAYKDVVHEYSQKTMDNVQTPDYLFRIGQVGKFFVEAKKPSVNLKDDIHPAFQLRRYAWSAKLPLSILTDFEELSIYDCRVQPKKNDKPSAARVRYFTYKDYIENWDEIESIFSRDAILKGSFDKYVESNKAKRGTTEVDDAFLKEIENWRELLARNIALRNSSLTNRDLNFAVQKTIDRIIFLRICEDRGIEDYGQLLSLQNGVNVYKRLLQIFTRADEKYNSGLFHFEKEKNRPEYPDELTPTLIIDDKLLKDIFRKLYYPDCPYEFSVLGADILGHVYEQFLGKVIRLTPSHQAKIEYKPEVKKAGGVYYTPTYIVDYIVKNTLGKKLEEIEKSNAERSEDSQIKNIIKDVAKLKILDPACGSGSFLLGAYQYLLNWHLEFYLNDREQIASLLNKKVPPIYQRGENDYRLTTAEKKRILLNNIFGVDIDSQAVEVTKLSLLLKVLEGETEETLAPQTVLFKQRALPDLGQNIKCGNSLIGPDFYDQTELELDEEERYRINVFDWNTEFEDIMSNGGFDCVIGNPPYRMVQPNNTDKLELDYYKNKFEVTSFKIDLYHLFYEKTLKLIKAFGVHGFIVPSPIMNNVYAKNLRQYIATNTRILSISLPNEKVFKNADVFTVVTIVQKLDFIGTGKHEVLLTHELENIKESKNVQFNSIDQIHFNSLEGNVWNILINKSNYKIINKLERNSKKLNTLSKINRGLISGNRQEYFSNKKINENYFPILSGSDILRYANNDPSEYINFVRPKTAGGCWAKAVHFSKHKVLIRQIGKRPCATLITNPIAITGNIFSIMADSLEREYLILGILNSNLLLFYWGIMFKDFKSAFPQVTISSIGNIPIKISKDFDSLSMKIIDNVKSMLETNKIFISIKTPQEKTTLQRQIEATDKQIDKLVYELYDLTEEEINIVEESFNEK